MHVGTKKQERARSPAERPLEKNRSTQTRERGGQSTTELEEEQYRMMPQRGRWEEIEKRRRNENEKREREREREREKRD